MFDNIIEETNKNILEKVDSRKEFVYLSELLENVDILKPYRTYFEAEVNWWIYEKKLQRDSNPNFDLKTPEIQSVLADLDYYYKKNSRFFIDDLTTIVNSAVKIRLNFILRPKVTLKWFVYHGEPTRSYKEIIQRLEYFFDYKYLIDGLMKWLDDKNVNTPDDLISIFEFEKAIEKIENNSIYDFNPEQFLDLLQPIFEFFNPIDNIEETTSVPAEALIIFFDDKKLCSISRRLEEFFFDRGLKVISQTKFLDFIYEMIEEFEKSSITKDLEYDELEKIVYSEDEDDFIKEDYSLQKIKNKSNKNNMLNMIKEIIDTVEPGSFVEDNSEESMNLIEEDSKIIENISSDSDIDFTSLNNLENELDKELDEIKKDSLKDDISEDYNFEELYVDSAKDDDYLLYNDNLTKDLLDAEIIDDNGVHTDKDELQL